MLAIVQGQRQAFFGMPLTDPVSMAETKGNIAGIQLTLQMPEMMIQDLQQQIDYKLAEMRAEGAAQPQGEI